ncbi:MAG TPA: hypothetical protein VKB58_15985 [Terriglobales bacterium]|jgi:hypothetical protein|nr:hypothetical protein [Terriglobales bacterium]
MTPISDTHSRISSALLRRGILFAVVLAITLPSRAQTCSTGADLDAATKIAINNAARQYLDMSKNGDVAGLRSNAIPQIAGDFGSIEQAVVTNKTYLAEGQSSIAGTYLLDASAAKSTLPRAEFYCGIYNSPDRQGFFIPNLPPGRYAVVIQKVNGKDPITLTLVLQNLASGWKLAGYYPRLDAIGGHDGQWYLTRAREYKAKGYTHDAWFYYLTAWDLTAPVNFMSTPQLDKIADEMQSARPADLPSDASPLSLSANGKVFKITELAAVPVDNNLDLRIRYQNPDAGNSGIAFQDNMAVIKAVVAKYPEFRDAFNSIIARAVDGSGHEYGSLLPAKDVK